MKKILSIVAFIVVGASYTYAQTATSTDGATIVDPNAPKFNWVSETYDFGTIPQGTPATCKYEFVNTGSTPMIITDVQRTCGCTNTDWSKDPILPGKKGFVNATYSAASEGAFNKAITVLSNADTPNVKLYFKGTVVKGDGSDTGTEGGAPEQKTIFNSGGN